MSSDSREIYLTLSVAISLLLTVESQGKYCVQLPLLPPSLSHFLPALLVFTHKADKVLSHSVIYISSIALGIIFHYYKLFQFS